MHENRTRTGMSQKNFVYSVIGRLLAVVENFVGRTIFVKTLGAGYLGIGGFFGNVFSVVALCELGIGAAIAQSLYKPLADGDSYKVSGIVHYYIKVCKIIGAVSFGLCLACLPLVPHMTKGEISDREIMIAFLLYSLHMLVSYRLTPKITLVICDMRLYAVTATRSIFGIVSLVLQSAALVFTGNYILYLFIRVLCLAAEDVAINRYADKLYPYLSLKLTVGKKYKKDLYIKVKALLWHKIGSTLSRSTDSLLLTHYVGLSGMGKYSNYALIIGTVTAFFDIAINAVSASVGNLGACDRGEKSENVMRRLYFLNFVLLTVGTSVLVSILNPFIEVWIGSDMLFGELEMAVIVSSFYFSCVRDPVQIFLQSFGLFRESRIIPPLRAVANLVFSVLFVKRIGVAGVFLGTMLSTVLVPLWMEVRVLYRHGFNRKCKDFAFEMAGYIAFSCFCSTVCFCMTSLIEITFFGVVKRAVIALCISIALLCAVFSKNVYFVFFRQLALKYLKSFVGGRKKLSF